MTYFWNHEYRYPMRDATEREQRLVRESFVAAGLPLDGVSELHKAIIDRTVDADRALSKYVWHKAAL